MPSPPHQDLVERRSGAIPNGNSTNEDEDSRIELAAHRLAVDFTEDADLPARFRNSSSSDKSRKMKEGSEVEKRFSANVKSWRQLIETMLGKISKKQAWRFIDVSPEVGPTIRKVTDCTDLRDFVDYLILRREKEQCDAGELGGLALLSTTFQREIEKRIQSLEVGEIAKPAGVGDASQGA